MSDELSAWFSADAEDGSVFEVEAGGGTAIGFTMQSPDKSSGNEDSIAIVHYSSDACALIVADGAGGLPGAADASQTAIAALLESLAVGRAAGTGLAVALADAVPAANKAVMALRNRSATTLTVVSVEGRQGRCFHVGDSAALVTGQRGAVRFATVGHSPVAFAVAAGLITEEESMFHIDRHIVSNFLGNPLMRMDISGTFELAARDTVLVCSDGLTDNLLTKEIIGHVRCKALAVVVPGLIQATLERMLNPASEVASKPDDLSLVVFRKPPT
ncbi:MAG: protein phosphatase 2C domain-containing protein [Pseudomonadota bacterium]